MARDKITEYDATANNNTVCGDVNIAENSALPSDMNNFAREIMSHLKEGLGSGTPLYVDQTNNRVGIGTSSPDTNLDIERSSNDTGGIKVQNTNNSQGSAVAQVEISGGDNAYANLLLECNSTNHSIRQDGSGNLKFINATTERMRIDSSGNVGIGTSSVVSSDVKLEVKDGIIAITDSAGGDARLFFGESTSPNHSKGQIRYSNADESLEFYSNSAERMRIDSSGRVGIGTSTVNQKLVLLESLGDTTLVIDNARSNVGDTGRIEFRHNSITGSQIKSEAIEDFSVDANRTSDLQFWTRNNGTISERMRIDSSGNLLVGTTATLISNGGPLQVKSRTGSEYVATFQNGVSDGGFGIRFLNVAGSVVGSIAWTGSVTNYNTSSDYRLKENVTADWDATTRLKQLNPVRFNFIADADTTVDGFLAHEVQSVVPEAVTGTHNEVDADGNPVYQGIDQSKLVPLLVKTIQELEARIVALETA